MVRVQITNRQRILAPAPVGDIRRVLRAAGEGVWDDAVISVVLLDGAEMERLNRRFTGRTGDTDVLAFPLEGPRAAKDDVAGEIVVCVSRARNEAAARGVAVRDETLLYVAHGAAHLLGYDDHAPGARRRMYAFEEAVLARAGLASVRSAAPRRVRPSARRSADRAAR